MKITAVKFRGKVHVAQPRHQDALNKMFKGWSQLSIRRAYDRVLDGKEDIVFGRANADGSGFEACECPEARKLMYGFA